MAEESSRKRSSQDDDVGSGEQPPRKRVRFPKGKKVRFEDLVVHEEGEKSLENPRNAAEERRILRCPSLADKRDLLASDITDYEAEYDPHMETLFEDGIQIEPFNLTKEREEGYFDESGHYVEYLNDNQNHDAWLDGVEVNKTYAPVTIREVPKLVQVGELSVDDIGKMKRRIADILEPNETVLKALKRLKGNSSNRKAKMSPETKRIFDQLTEDAMWLMEKGEYNVYQDRQESFKREAEGYEMLAKARSEDFNMFEEDNEKPTDVSDMVDQGSGDNQEDDYVYDDSTGYYYSSGLGYYYDPATGFYCNAALGQWFSYNVETGAYDEV